MRLGVKKIKIKISPGREKAYINLNKKISDLFDNSPIVSIIQYFCASRKKAGFFAAIQNGYIAAIKNIRILITVALFNTFVKITANNLALFL